MRAAQLKARRDARYSPFITCKDPLGKPCRKCRRAHRKRMLPWHFSILRAAEPDMVFVVDAGRRTITFT